MIHEPSALSGSETAIWTDTGAPTADTRTTRQFFIAFEFESSTFGTGYFTAGAANLDFFFGGKFAKSASRSCIRRHQKDF
jgi:hypothetical protein